MSKQDENVQDSTGLGWVIIVAIALVWATMPVSIGINQIRFAKPARIKKREQQLPFNI